jgi:hypothetical protein
MQRKVNDAWIRRKLGTKGIFIIICFIVVALIVDTSIVKISAFTGGLRSAESSIAIFTGMALIFAIGQYVILGFIRRRNHESIAYYKLWLSVIHKAVSIILYALIVIFGALILQMVFTLSYNVLFLEVVIWINYILGIALLGFLSQRFLSWFKSNRNAVVLAYCIAIMMIATNAVFTLVYVTNGLISAQRGVTIQPAVAPLASYGSVYDIFNSAYFITSILSFILTWVATVLLLRSYYRKLGRGKYSPLFVFQNQFCLGWFTHCFSARLYQPVAFYLVSHFGVQPAI